MPIGLDKEELEKAIMASEIEILRITDQLAKGV